MEIFRREFDCETPTEIAVSSGDGFETRQIRPNDFADRLDMPGGIFVRPSSEPGEFRMHAVPG